jgi:hypothetical protein
VGELVEPPKSAVGLLSIFSARHRLTASSTVVDHHYHAEFMDKEPIRNFFDVTAQRARPYQNTAPKSKIDGIDVGAVPSFRRHAKAALSR